jgi:hypothetical protein
VREEGREPTVFLHVAAAAEQRDVLGRVVAGVPVPVVTVGGGCPAALTVPQRVRPLRSLALGAGDRRVSLPLRAALSPLVPFRPSVACIRARHAMPAQVDRARLAESFSQRRVSAETIRAGFHTWNIRPAMSHRNNGGHDAS